MSDFIPPLKSQIELASQVVELNALLRELVKWVEWTHDVSHVDVGECGGCDLLSRAQAAMKETNLQRHREFLKEVKDRIAEIKRMKKAQGGESL